ncbi:MAG: glucose 1-dehydrogenase [Coxiellaceae bacterium]|nr:glucose 1-dehydrogenase [Coxiellaceae bacterium]
MRLKDKTALITGAASGIGRACAELFVAEGANVILTDIDDKLGEAVALTLGDKAMYLHLDVVDEAKWRKVVNTVVERFRKLDILVNNAGITGLGGDLGPQDPENASLKSWDEVHRINADSVFLGCREAIRVMKESGGGSIVNMSSRSGMVGVPHMAAYASSKASNRNFTKSVALYCAEKNYNIRCNSIHPASILTPIWDDMFGEGEEHAKHVAAMSRNIPLGRMGEPKDVAYAALYLASDESSFVTGIELTVDGGILAGTASSPKPR